MLSAGAAFDPCLTLFDTLMSQRWHWGHRLCMGRGVGGLRRPHTRSLLSRQDVRVEGPRGVQENASPPPARSLVSVPSSFSASQG